ncbi:MAG TPA: HAMP domain-containing sensor histidine kinase [Polyangiaceae bacterium]|jgi:signal transduction histidine kinase
MRISGKLTLGVIAGIVAILAISSYLTVNREVLLFETDMARDHEIFAQAVAASMARVWRVDGRAHALGLLEQLDAGEGSVRVRFVPKDGTPSDPHIKPDALASVLRGGGPLHDKLEGASPKVYSYAAVHLGSEVPGVLEVSESLEPRDAYVRSTVLRAAITALCLGIVCAALTFLLGSSIVGRPVRALVAQARKIGAGELGSRLDFEQHDEIAELGREMNAMSTKLADANARLVAETAARVHALEQLRHADRLVTVGKLASGIAHELGTPLNVVSGRAKMISQNAAADEPTRNNARIVMDQTQRMAQIIRQLLDFARAGKPNKTRIDLRNLVAGTLSLLRPIADKRKVTLAFETSEEPVADVVADAAQLQQVITNLVVNGVQATPESGIVTVRLRTAHDGVRNGGAGVARPERGFACITVDDRGIGMSAETLERIFEPFFTTKDVGDGTGLGLAVAYGIVQEHGGFITVESKLGVGSRFEVYLPVPDPQ